MDEVDVLKEEYTPYMIEIQKTYDTQICGFEGDVCTACGACNKEATDGHRYSSPTKGIILEDKVTYKGFDKF